MWELRYLVGGRELLHTLGKELVIGESFVFLRPEWGQHPLIASILKTVGIQETPGQVFSLWGKSEIPIPGGVIQQQPVPALGFCSLWTDRPLYRENRDPIKVFIFYPLPQVSQLAISIWRDGKLLDRQSVILDQYGLCQLELQNLPAGRYRLVVGGDKAETHFTIAHARICTLSGRWMQCYTRPVDHHRSVLVFVIQLESFGRPIQDEFQIQLYDEGRAHSIPISYESCRSDGGGRIAGELLLEGSGPFSVEIQSYTDPTKWSLLSVPLQGTEAPHERAQLIGPLGPIHSWQWDPLTSMGLRIDRHETSSSTPLVLDKVVAHKATLQVHQTVDACTLVVLDPIRGTSDTFTWPELFAGQSISCPVPQPFGIIAVGGFVQGIPWEGWSLVVPPSALQLSVSATPRQHIHDPLAIHIQTHTDNEVPVFVVIREHSEQEAPEPWGPAQAMLNLTDELLPPMFLGNPNESLWSVAERHTKRPTIAPPKNLPPPQTPGPDKPTKSTISPNKSPQSSTPEKSGKTGPVPVSSPSGSLPTPPVPSASPSSSPPSAAATSEGNTAYRLPPQSEEFPHVVFSGLLHVRAEEALQLPAPSEHGEYRVEAVALTETSWSYAACDLLMASPTFCELLIPPHAHAENSVMGEAVIMTDQPTIYADLWKDQQPVAMYADKQPVTAQTPLQGPLIQLQFTVTPGLHLLRIADQHGQLLDTVEAEVHPWGISFQEGWGVQFIAAGQSWSASDSMQTAFSPASVPSSALVPSPPVSPDTQIMAIPHLLPMIKQIAAELLHRSQDHCESEAARLCAALFLLPYADHLHHHAQLSQAIQQILDRLVGMFVPQRGFKLYPDQGHEPHWGQEALFHLWDILLLDRRIEQQYPGYSRLLSARHNHPWKASLLHLLDEVAAAYHTSIIPHRIHTVRDAFRVYLLETTPARREEALWEIQKRLQQEHGVFSLPYENPVIQRQEGCYAALTLLATADPVLRPAGLVYANQLLKAWPSAEHSYSTKEGIALLTLLEYVQRFLLAPSQTQASLNGRDMRWSELSQPVAAQELRVSEGIAPLGFYFPKLPKDLKKFAQPIPWTLRMYRPDNPAVEVREVELGDRLHIVVDLPEPADVGDLLELYLPPALAWLDGERHEKQFAVPIYSLQRIELPLVAIATTQTIDGQIGIQHWGVRLSNLYQSYRGNASFHNSIVVWGRGSRKRESQQQWLQRWRKIFG